VHYNSFIKATCENQQHVLAACGCRHRRVCLSCVCFTKKTKWVGYRLCAARLLRHHLEAGCFFPL